MPNKRFAFLLDRIDRLVAGDLATACAVRAPATISLLE
jgi:hypothetical protein